MEVSPEDRARFCRCADAFCFVCDSSSDSAVLHGYRQPLQDWLSADPSTKNAPLVVISTHGDSGVRTIEEVNESLGLYNLWTRHWNAVLSPQDAAQALPWLSTQLD